MEDKLAAHLVFVGVKALRVDTTIVNDVAVGLGDVTSLAAMVPFMATAVQQVLLTKWNQNSCPPGNLSLQSP